MMAKKTEIQKAAARAAREAKRKKAGETLIRVADILSKGASAVAHAHPIAIGLFIMTGCVGVKFALGKERPGNAHLHRHINDLYGASQTIALASAAVPVVAGGLNLIGSALASRGSRTS